MDDVTTSVEVCGASLLATIDSADCAVVSGKAVKYRGHTYDVTIVVRFERGKWSPVYTSTTITILPSKKDASSNATHAFCDSAATAIAELAKTSPLLFQEAKLVRLAKERGRKYEAFRKAKDEKSTANSAFYKALAQFKKDGGDGRKYEHLPSE